jgi:ribosome maturation factor RimP
MTGYIVRLRWMALSSGGPKGPPLFVCPSGASCERIQALLRGKTAEDQKLIPLLDPVAEAAGFEIVRLRLTGGGAHARRLQVMAERPDGTMVVEDCARLARAVSQVLDAADPISGEYTLEVSSPGVDRPLTRRKDFEAFEVDRLADGRKRFRGELAGMDGDNVAINLEGEAETTLVPFDWLVEARLVITDALLEHGAKARAARLEHDNAAAGGSPTDLQDS